MYNEVMKIPACPIILRLISTLVLLCFVWREVGPATFIAIALMSIGMEVYSYLFDCIFKCIDGLNKALEKENDEKVPQAARRD